MFGKRKGIRGKGEIFGVSLNHKLPAIPDLHGKNKLVRITERKVRKPSLAVPTRNDCDKSAKKEHFFVKGGYKRENICYNVISMS